MFLTYEGEITGKEAAAARLEVNTLLVAKQWNRVLVDATEWRSIPTAVELFEFARGLSLDFTLKTRIALVVRPEQAKHARLIEKVARNDNVFLTYFVDAEKATTWVTGTLPRHDAQVWHGAEPGGKRSAGSHERPAHSAN